MEAVEELSSRIDTFLYAQRFKALMSNRKFKLDEDERILKKAPANLHFEDQFKTPKIGEGKLILTNKRIVFTGLSLTSKLVSKATEIALSQLGLRKGPTVFTEPFKDVISINLSEIKEVRKGGRSLRALGMRTLQVVHRSGKIYEFQLAGTSLLKLDDWINAIRSEINARMDVTGWKFQGWE